MLRNERSKLILTLIAAIMVSIFINIIILINIVDPYLIETNRVVNLFEFYDQTQEDSEDEIFFLGSSQIAGDLNTIIIEESLKIQEISANIYNLGYSADTPLRRITELSQLLKSKPDMVIVGFTYYGLNNKSFPISSDSLALVSNKIELDPYSRALFPRADLELIGMDSKDIYLYKRRFILDSLQHFLVGRSQNHDEDVRDFKNPQTFGENLTQELLLIRLNNSRDMLDKYIVYPEDNTQKRALNYTISQLVSNGITVIVINMPLNPLLSEEITDETRRNYFSFLNATNVICYDLEKRYRSEYFSDLTHLNPLGKQRFSEDMAQIISRSRKLHALQ